MFYEAATARLINDVEVKPELLELMVEESGMPTRFDAIRTVVADTAPNFVAPDDEYARPGQLAHGLSEWHRYLLNQCSVSYWSLTADPNGPRMNREEANADPQLQTLQAIRRGVRMAMNRNFRMARGSRHF